MPFPYDFPLQFEWWHIEKIVLESKIYPRPPQLNSPINKRLVLISTLNKTAVLPGRL